VEKNFKITLRKKREKPPKRELTYVGAAQSRAYFGRFCTYAYDYGGR
jgi:hypothetical protein